MRAFLLGLLLSLGLTTGTLAHAKAPIVGEAAPDFTLTLIDGSKVSLADLRGE